MSTQIDRILRSMVADRLSIPVCMVKASHPAEAILITALLGQAGSEEQLVCSLDGLEYKLGFSKKKAVNTITKLLARGWLSEIVEVTGMTWRVTFDRDKMLSDISKLFGEEFGCE